MIDNQVVPTMFDIKTYIHMARFVPHRDWDEDSRLRIHSDIWFTQAMKEVIWAFWYLCCHIDPCCIGIWLCFIILQLHYVFCVATISSCHRSMDPHCISGGHTLSQYHHGSVVYLLATILWVTYSLSIGLTSLGMEHILTFFDGCL